MNKVKVLHEFHAEMGLMNILKGLHNLDYFMVFLYDKEVNTSKNNATNASQVLRISNTIQ